MVATISEVKQGLDDIAAAISVQQAVIDKAQSNAGLASAALSALATEYADLIATVNAYTPTGPFEMLAQDELTQLTTEFQSLKAKADAIVAQA